MDDEEEDADLALSTSTAEPRTYAESTRRPDAQHWHQAALDELAAHESNGTWSLVERPADRKVIGSKWVFKLKRNADGSIDRYKARLVAKGYNQRPGFDFLEIFAPTVRMPTIRVVLALAALHDLHLRSVDVSNAYLNGEMDCDVYMEQPEGFAQKDSRKYVCLLQKALYGTKQGGNRWNRKMRSVLESLGFQQTYSDAAIYILCKGDVRIILPVFVDDMTFASKSLSAIEEMISALRKHFKLRDLGPTTQLLGIKIDRDRPNRSITLSQRQYCLDILDRFGMADCKPVSTPMDPGLRLTRDHSPQTREEAAQMRSIDYQGAVGALMYLATTTRPDIAYTVGVLARFNSNPGLAHWAAVKHLLRYLKGTASLSLTYSPDPSTPELFTTYSDADHGGCKDTGRSTGAYLIKMGTGAISWSSKLQGIVALSSTEAEYIAAVEAGKEVVWLRKLLQEMGFSVSQPSVLRIDNQSAIQVAKHPEHHGRMKQLDLRWFWLRDMVDREVISPQFVPTDQMPADLLTKPLARVKVQQFCEMMGLAPLGGS